MKHILTVDQFTKSDINDIFSIASYYRFHNEDYPPLQQSIGKQSRPGIGRILTNLFYEPSTRTSSSFYSAMVKLGGSVIPINDVNYSSVVKGETLEDTIRTLECYSDVIVLRHKEVGAAQRAAAVASVPIINAGDGIGEHPTQALLDLFTILIERDWYYTNPIETIINSNLSVSLVGDLKHGRTVKSLAKLLRKYDVNINWISPADFRIPEDFILDGEFETDSLDDVIETTDVIYMTRVQAERHENTLQTTENHYSMTQELMDKAKENMVLMHPLPRVSELPSSLDSDPRSAYFRQMKYGLFVRMALLEMILPERR